MKNFELENLQAIKIPTSLGDIITIYNIVTGNLYFIAKQIAAILGYYESNRLTKILKSREFNSASQAELNKIKDLGSIIQHEMSPRGMTIINLAGLNRASIISTKPEASIFQDEIIPKLESYIESEHNKSKNSNDLNKILTLLEKQESHNQQLKTETFSLKTQLSLQAVQTEQRIVALETSLIKKLKVKIEFNGYGVKNPRTSCDVDTYVTIFNSKYKKNITKTIVHLLLRKFNLMNQNNTTPTEYGLKSGAIGREMFDIIYKNGTIGKSIKTVIYEDAFEIIDKEILNIIN